MKASKTSVPIIEEELRVDKHSVITGRVRVQTVTDVLDEIAKAELETSDVEVTRVPIGREVDSPPAMRTTGDTVIVPVLEEVLVVEKRLILKEELHITRRVTTETVEMPVSLRKQRPIITREESGPPNDQHEDKDNG